MIRDWANDERAIEMVRLYGSRAKGCARPSSDVDLAITTSFGSYVALADKWAQELSHRLGLKAHVKQYNSPSDDNPVPEYCAECSFVLFRR